MGGGPSMDEQLSLDKQFMDYVYQQQKNLTDTQGANFQDVIRNCDNLLSTQITETLDKQDDLVSVSKEDLKQAKQDLGKQPNSKPQDQQNVQTSQQNQQNAQPNQSQQTAKPMDHTPPPGTIVMLNAFDCIYNNDQQATFSWLGDAIKNFVTSLTSVATLAAKDPKEATAAGGSIGAVVGGSQALLETFSAIFSSATSIAMVSNGVASVLQSILSSFDSVKQTSLHMNKTIRFIAPGAYVGVYICDSSFFYKGAFKTTSYKLSCYGLYMATSLDLMKQLEKLDTMRSVFSFYRGQLTRFDSQSSNITTLLDDTVNLKRQIGKFNVVKVLKTKEKLKTDFLKDWLSDIVEGINDAILTEDIDAIEATEAYNNEILDLPRVIDILLKSRNETYDTMNKYVDQLAKLSKI